MLNILFLRKLEYGYPVTGPLVPSLQNLSHHPRKLLYYTDNHEFWHRAIKVEKNINLRSQRKCKPPLPDIDNCVDPEGKARR